MIRCAAKPTSRANSTSCLRKTRNKRNDRARHICVDQKAHAVLSGGKWVKRLLLGKLADESERRSSIVDSQIVLALNFFKGHAAGEAANHDCHRNTRPTNDGFSVTNSRIDNDAVMSLHGDSNLTGFAQLVEISISFGADDSDVAPDARNADVRFWQIDARPAMAEKGDEVLVAVE